ncbi:acyl carrier protein [Streptomyces sp. NPDC059076]|uniref:acyl carrier protein n=1 Tax=unclassified Streptomyces TaxID=2593676 RepID=UPI0036B68E93
MPARTVTVEFFEQWVTGRIADYLEVPVDDIEVDENIIHYGVDSLARASLGADIEDEFGVEVDLELFKDCVTIEAIVAALPQITSQPTTEVQEPR